MMNSHFPRLIAFISLVLLPNARAASATWASNPPSDQWQVAHDWMPKMVPHTDADTAIFGQSNVTNVLLGVRGRDITASETFLDKVVFTKEAPAYTITLTPNGDYGIFLSIDGDGIINESDAVQNIVVAASSNATRSAELSFNDFAAIGDKVVITNLGAVENQGDGAGGGETEFGRGESDSADAGNATYINQGANIDGGFGGGTLLSSECTAEAATFINNPGTVSGAGGGGTLFYTYNGGSVGAATIICNAATVQGAGAGTATIAAGGDGGGSFANTKFFAYGENAPDLQSGHIEIEGGQGYATFTAAGGNGEGAQGGSIDLDSYGIVSFSGENLVVAEGGSNGGLGGTITIQRSRGLEMSQYRLYGNGLLDLTPLIPADATIGSLTGTGVVDLSTYRLKIGANNLDSTFSGLIKGLGSVEKVGSGTFTLSGANTYDGGTFVTAGALVVSNMRGSATGRGAVTVHAGLLGGNGIIAGPVTIGAGNGASASLAPAARTETPTILTIQKTLTFRSGATYACALRVQQRRASADEVVANGVAIEGGAQFHLLPKGRSGLHRNATFTVINNTSSTPIEGTFSNLPDGAIVTIGSTKLQANYEGGDGNDLTLTVVP